FAAHAGALVVARDVDQLSGRGVDARLRDREYRLLAQLEIVVSVKEIAEEAKARFAAALADPEDGFLAHVEARRFAREFLEHRLDARTLVHRDHGEDAILVGGIFEVTRQEV